MNLAAMLRTQAERMPQAAAIVVDDETVSYGELHCRVEAAAWHLQEHGVRPGDTVVTAARSSVVNTVALFATARLGAATCLLDWRTRAPERQAILEAFAPRLYLTDRPSSVAEAVPVAAIDAAWATSPMPPGPLPDDPDLPAILLLSSGSTGRPKGMILSQRAAIWRAMLRVVETDLRPGTRMLNALPAGGTSAIQTLLGQVLAGATAWQMPALFSAQDLLEVLRRERIEQTTLVPTMVRGLLELATQDQILLPELTALRVVGAAFHPDEIRSVLDRLTPNLFEGYGAAGAGGICKATPHDLRSKPGSVGRAMMFVALEIVDEDDRRVANGSIGRIRVRTLGAASGYAGASGQGEHDEVFRDGYVYPGDLGHLDDDGYLYIDGRAASIIIRGGQNIYPEEIERILQSHPAVSEAAVCGVEDATFGELPIALVVCRSPIASSQLIGFCITRLQSYKVPERIHFVASLPRTNNGKILRSALPALAAR